MHSKAEFTKAYRENYSDILRFLQARLNNRSVAEDLAGEVFYKAWRGRLGFQADTSSRAWLFRIARNTLIDYWRKKKEVPMDRAGYPEVTWGGLTPEQSLHQQDEVWELMKALDQLPGKLQAVTVLRFIEGLSAKQAAEVLDTTEGNVRIMQFRALAKLKGIMKEDHE